MPPRKTRTTSHRSNWNTSTRSTKSATATYACSSPKFKNVRDECQWRMGSYRNVYSQFNGAGQKTILSPTNANKWMKYINNGAQVYKFNNKDFCKWFGSKWTSSTPRSAYRWLKQKYGSSIKDVARGKGNCWLVATTRTPGARPFTNYPWK